MADSPLQKAPAGLLGLFDLKTQGENPNLFSGTVVPTADVRQHYGSNGQQVLEVTTVASLVGTTMLFTVPDSQIYRVLAIGSIVVASIGAVHAADLNMALVIDRTLAVIVAQNSYPLRGVTATVAEEYHLGHWFNEPPLLQPGWRFGTRNAYSSSSNMNQLCRAIVQPLPL